MFVHSLGDVLSALTTKKDIVPYKDSKLTELLSDSLGKIVFLTAYNLNFSPIQQYNLLLQQPNIHLVQINTYWSIQSYQVKCTPIYRLLDMAPKETVVHFLAIDINGHTNTLAMSVKIALQR